MKKIIKNIWYFFFPPTPLDLLKKYFRETDEEAIKAEWDAIRDDFEGPTIDEFIEKYL